MTYKEITLRGCETQDSRLLSAWWNDGRVMAHAGYPYGTGETPAQIEKKISAEQDGISRRFIIEYRGIPIGETNYRQAAPETAEIGIKICNETFQKRGFGRIALSLLITELFEAYGFTRIILDTNLNNKRARHVYETLGFQQIGVRPNAFRGQDGT